MLFEGFKIIPLDSRWRELSNSLEWTHYDDIIAYDKNPIQEAGSSRVYHINSDKQNFDDGVYLKKIIPDHPLKFFLRASKSRREANNYKIMSALQVPSPEVISMGEKRKFGSLESSFIITEGIAKTITLEQYAHEHWDELPADAVETIMDQLINIVRKMHKANFYHVDLQWRNILVQENTLKIFIIDSTRGGRRFLPFRKWRGKMHDLAGLEKLARLYLTPKQRLRWFKKYTGSAISRKDKRLIRDILSKVEYRRLRRESYKQ